MYSADQVKDLEAYLSAKKEGRTTETILPCGFKYSLMLYQYRDQLSPEMKRLLKIPLSEPPVLEDSLFSPSGKFLLHFSRSGNDAVPPVDASLNGVPDFIDSAGVVLDYVRRFEIDSLGFQPPLNVAGEPVSVYHVYFMDLGNEYGVTYLAKQIPEAEGYFHYTSYIIFDNDYLNENFPMQGLRAFRVTAAHEFNHAIQVSYRVWWENQKPVDLYLMEMTSTWLEDVVFNRANNYLEYLPYFFRKFSNTSFTSANYLFPYGNSLFFHLLEKEYGCGIVPEIWERIREGNGLESLDRSLLAHNSSLLSKLHQYGIWLYFTGSRADTTNYFPEGNLYPELTVLPQDVYSYSDTLQVKKLLSPLTNRIIRFNDVSDGEYKIKVNSLEATGMLSHLIPRGIVNTVSFNQSGFFYFGYSGNITAVLTNVSSDSALVDYNLTAGLEISGGDLFVVPNPVRVGEQNSLSFVNIPGEGEIHIFNSNGEKITQLSARGPFKTVIWDLQDETGRPVNSGIYLYLFQGAKKTRSGKIAIIR